MKSEDRSEITLTHLGNLLLDLVERNIVGNDEGDLKLADTVADGDEGRGTPDEALARDGANRLLELGHVGLVVPRLDVHGDNGLADGGRALGGLLLVVGGDTLGLDALALGVLLLVVRAEEVDVVLVLLLLSAGRGRGAAEERLGGGSVSRERRELRLERLDVRVPAGRVRVLGGRRGRLESGEDAGVSLRGRVATKEIRCEMSALARVKEGRKEGVEEEGRVQVARIVLSATRMAGVLLPLLSITDQAYRSSWYDGEEMGGGVGGERGQEQIKGTYPSM